MTQNEGSGFILMDGHPVYFHFYITDQRGTGLLQPAARSFAIWFTDIHTAAGGAAGGVLDLSLSETPTTWRAHISPRRSRNSNPSPSMAA